MSRRMAEYVCEQCGAEFVARAEASARYCSRQCCGVAKRGVSPANRHPLYNGGLCFDKGGNRWRIMCRDGTQMPYYRGVMAGQVGRLLRSDELVHHVNEDSADDRPDNLEITTRPIHIETHRAQLLAGKRRKAAA